MTRSDTPVLWLPIRHVLRVVLEARTPFSLASGEASGDLDMLLLRDWNGLPCLSGPSLIGVLRSLHADFESWFGPGSTTSLFGYEETGSQAGVSSRLMATFGLALDAKGAAQDGYRMPTDIGGDPVLRLLSQEAPLFRDHVAVDAHGVAVKNAKFDRVACPVGTRFVTDLYLDGAADDATADAACLANLARLFAAPQARFGGGGRRGLGRLRIATENGAPMAYLASIDRRGPAGRVTWMAFQQAAPHRTNMKNFRRLAAKEAEAPPSASSASCAIEAALTFQPAGYWRMGSGGTPWREETNQSTATIAPLREPVIRWATSGAQVEPLDVTPIPGSGVKGALAHRAEFHLRRMRGVFADTSDKDVARLMNEVLGQVLDKDDGEAGFLHIDDAILPVRGAALKTGHRTRNSIDRHSGGVRLKKLFTDEALWKGPEVSLALTLVTSRGERKIQADAVRALDWAIEDLIQGRLALGARGASGDGVMQNGRLKCWVGSRTFDTFEAALNAVRQDVTEQSP